MEIRSELRKQSRSGKKKWAILIGILALTHILLFLSYGDSLRTKLSNENNALMMSPSQNTLLRNTLALNVSAHVLEKNGYVSGFSLVNDSEDDEGFDNNVDFESFEDVKDIKEVAGSNFSLVPLEKTLIQEEVSDSNNGHHVKNVTLQSDKNLKNPMSSAGSSKAGSVLKQASKKKKLRCELPPKTVTTIDEMNQILARHRRSSRAMRPRWSSRRDEEILAARKEIEHAPVATVQRELYPPIFRNVSMFKR